jgi:poly-gamma-glutamate synthase PgsB/CapB
LNIPPGKRNSSQPGVSSLIVLLIVLGVLLGFMAWEYQVHQWNLRKVPTRIHVNGTRGKSSVTRLIAAGLRAGGVVTCAKTTGSRPRMILEDGSEYSIQRQGRANILEQLRAVAVTSRRGASALVAECMALNPILQVLRRDHKRPRRSPGRDGTGRGRCCPGAGRNHTQRSSAGDR